MGLKSLQNSDLSILKYLENCDYERRYVIESADVF